MSSLEYLYSYLPLLFKKNCILLLTFAFFFSGHTTALELWSNKVRENCKSFLITIEFWWVNSNFGHEHYTFMLYLIIFVVILTFYERIRNTQYHWTLIKVSIISFLNKTISWCSFDVDFLNFTFQKLTAKIVLAKKKLCKFLYHILLFDSFGIEP